jgi:DNA-binding LacI/PurR family transcriptional regulator
MTQGHAGGLRAVTAKEVARLAGVSHQTVSRVVNGTAGVHADTRARVLEAIERLGYEPDEAASRLARRPRRRRRSPRDNT